MNISQTEETVEKNSNTSTSLIPLLPSGLQSPPHNFSDKYNFILTQYERQILRSYYSNGIAKIQINNKNYYIVIFESEMQIIKFEVDNMISIKTQEFLFCSFILPLQQKGNPKIFQFLLIDRQNKFMTLELDFIREDTPQFPIREYEELEKINIFQKEIFQQVFLSKDYQLLILISKSKVYFLNLINYSINSIANPIIDQNNYQQQQQQLITFIELSQDKEYLVLAHGNQIYIINNYKVFNTFQLGNKIIINIKLCQNKLNIVTNKAYTSILNIQNNFIQIKEKDYYYFDEETNYGHFEIEDDNLNFILLIYKTGKIAYFDTTNEHKGQFKSKTLNFSIDKNYIVKYVELENQIQQQIKFRIFYFTLEKQLGSIQFQANI